MSFSQRAREVARERHCGLVSIVIDGRFKKPPQGSISFDGPVSDAILEQAWDFLHAAVESHEKQEAER